MFGSSQQTVCCSISIEHTRARAHITHTPTNFHPAMESQLSGASFGSQSCATWLRLFTYGRTRAHSRVSVCYCGRITTDTFRPTGSRIGSSLQRYRHSTHRWELAHWPRHMTQNTRALAKDWLSSGTPRRVHRRMRR